VKVKEKGAAGEVEEETGVDGMGGEGMRRGQSERDEGSMGKRWFHVKCHHREQIPAHYPYPIPLPCRLPHLKKVSPRQRAEQTATSPLIIYKVSITE
jgi:hypothetical protein